MPEFRSEEVPPWAVRNFREGQLRGYVGKLRYRVCVVGRGQGEEP